MSAHVRYVLALALCVAAVPAGSQTFYAARTFAAGHYVDHVVVEDFDRDARPDLAVAKLDPPVSVLILRGNGDGTFEAPIELPAHGGTTSLAAGDMDGDGAPDLVFTWYSYTTGSSGVSILRGNGDGTFQSAVDYVAGDHPTCVTVGDLDGDGAADLAVANSGSNDVSILRGNGDGTFQAAVSHGAGDQPTSVAVEDLDGDGAPDLAVANSGSHIVSVLGGNGDGTFQAAVDFDSGTDAKSMVVRDFDGDGRRDLAVGTSILLGKGDGTFQPAVLYRAGSASRGVAVGDLDGDGQLDLVAANPWGVSILTGNGDGTFRAIALYAVEGAYESGTRAMAVADLDGDGRSDLALTHVALTNGSYSYGVWILRGHGDGSFQPSVRLAHPSLVTSVAVEDFDGDGAPDLALASSSGVSILRGNGDGTFQSAVSYPAGAGTGTNSVAVADLDVDGRFDLAVASRLSYTSSHNVSILRGNGDGTFQSAVSYSSGNATYGPNSVAVADLDGDGRPDLAVANDGAFVGTDSVAILRGNGDGTFQTPVSYRAGDDHPTSVAVADFDGDGRPDLAVANAGSDTVAILRGNGDGTFQSAVSYGAGDGTSSVAVADLDGDGRLDVAAANLFGGSVSVLRGNGDGTLQAATTYGLPSSAGAVALGYLDGDGQLDLAVASSNAVSILLNTTALTVRAPTVAAITTSGATLGGHVASDGGRPVIERGVVFAETRVDPDPVIGAPGVCQVRVGGTAAVFAVEVTGLWPGTEYSFKAYAINETDTAYTRPARTFTTPFRTLSIGHRSITERDVDLTFTVSLSDATTEAVRVDYATEDGTASAGSDYVGQRGTLTLPPGTTSQALSIAILEDTVEERDERFTVRLSAPVHADLARSAATGTIRDDDPAPEGSPTVSIDDRAVSEGMKTAGFTIRLSAPSTQTVYVSYATTDGSAVAGADYVAKKGGLAFLPGETEKKGFVPLMGDAEDERDETFTVTLSAPMSATIADAKASVTILDDDSPGGAPTFYGVQHFGDGDGWGSKGAALADLDGDARLDLVVAEPYDSGAGFAILRGNGNGTFRAPIHHPTSSYPQSVTVGDLDGDGRLDLAMATSYSPTGVSIVRGNGDGTFQTAIHYGIGKGGGRSVAVGEFNGDGHPDLAVALESTSAIMILRGNGDGTFQVSETSGGGTGSLSVAVGDFDGDGRQDLAAANYFYSHSGTVSILRGNGDGTFQAAVSYGTGDYPHSVAVGDLDGDGRPDLAVANAGSDTVSILRGNGDGSFRAAVDYAVANYPRHVAMSDLDGDGHPDLAVANGYSTNVSILRGNGDGTFETAVIHDAGLFPVSVAAGDLDGDGAPDLAVGTEFINGVTILRGNGDGTFQTAPHYGVGASPASAAVGDLDGDDRLDLAVANESSDDVSILRGNGDGTFQAALSHGAGDRPVSVVEGDLDGDGRSDLAVANHGSDDISILRGNGDGTFQTAVSYRAGDGPRSLAAADVDGDGTPDFAVANCYSDNVSILRGQGDGTLQAAVDYRAGDCPTSVAVGDLDGDGPPDLAVADLAYPGQVSILRGNGDGTFQAAVAYGAGNYPLSVKISDLDGDGRPDLAVVGHYDLSILRGNGDGTFQAPVRYRAGDGTAGQHPTSLAVGDLDGDRTPDLAVGITNASVAALVLRGNGDGTFQAAASYGSGWHASAVAMGDLDGDGQLDLAVARLSNDVSILLNTTAPTVRWPRATAITATSAALGGLVTSTTVPITGRGVVYAEASVNPDPVIGATGVTQIATSGTTGLLAVDVTGLSPGTRYSFKAYATHGADTSYTAARRFTTRFPPLSIADRSITEGDSGTRYLTFTVTLAQASASTVSVDYATEDGTAVSGSDYVAKSGTLVLPPGTMSKTLSIAVLGDTEDERDEQFRVRLSAPIHATLARRTATGTIADDDPAPPGSPAVSIGNHDVSEGAASATFKATLSAPSTLTVYVSWVTTDASAVAGVDYQSKAGLLTFLPGETAKQGFVPLIDDVEDERDEAFTIELSAPVNATLGGSGEVTILDDDDGPPGSPALSISDTAAPEGNAGTTVLSFRATMSVPSTKTVQVHYETVADTATAGSDYAPIEGVLTFGPGTRSQVIAVSIRGDVAAEPDETVKVRLWGPYGATVEDDIGRGTIQNDDP